MPVAAGKVIGAGGQCGMKGGMTSVAVKVLCVTASTKGWS